MKIYVPKKPNFTIFIFLMNLSIYLTRGLFNSLTENVLLVSFALLLISFAVKQILPNKWQIVIMIVSFVYMYQSVLEGKNELGNIAPIMILFLIITYSEKTTFSSLFFSILDAVGLIVMVTNLIRIVSKTSYVNVNTCCIIAMLIFFISMISEEIKKPRYRKTRRGVYGGLCIATCLLGSNSTIVICLIFWIIISHVIPERFWKSVKRVKLIVSAEILVGTAYPFLYIIYYIWGRKIPTIDYIFSGREYIWINYLNKAMGEKGGILYGLGSSQEAAIGYGMTMHNSYLEMVLYFGVIMVVLFWMYLMVSVNDECINKMNRVNVLCLTSYIVILLASYTEYFIQNALFVVIANCFWGMANNPALVYIGEKSKLRRRKYSENHVLSARQFL